VPLIDCSGCPAYNFCNNRNNGISCQKGNGGMTTHAFFSIRSVHFACEELRKTGRRSRAHSATARCSVRAWWHLPGGPRALPLRAPRRRVHRHDDAGRYASRVTGSSGSAASSAPRCRRRATVPRRGKPFVWRPDPRERGGSRWGAALCVPEPRHRDRFGQSRRRGRHARRALGVWAAACVLAIDVRDGALCFDSTGYYVECPGFTWRGPPLRALGV